MHSVKELPMRCSNRPSRREFVQLAGLTSGMVGMGGAAFPSTGWAADPPAADRKPGAVLEQLIEGNQRFVNGMPRHGGPGNPFEAGTERWPSGTLGLLRSRGNPWSPR
jgi:hypothetical protein